MVSPAQVEHLLKEIGYKIVDSENNGWEQDRWTYFMPTQPDLVPVYLFSCGYTFRIELSLWVEKE